VNAIKEKILNATFPINPIPSRYASEDLTREEVVR